MKFGCRKEAEGQGAVDGAAAEGADLVDGIKDMVFGSEDEAAAAVAAAAAAGGGAAGGEGQVYRYVKKFEL